MTGQATAAVAVLTWRGYQITRACVASLTRSATWPFPVLVVDNDSGTGEGERIAREFGAPVEAITLRNNGGVPAGYNAAIDWATEREMAYVLLLNNDTVVTDPMLITTLLRAAGPGIAAVGPIIRTPGGIAQSAGGVMHWATGRATHLQETGSDVDAYDVDWLDGSCLFISTEAAKVIGGLATEYFLYWEEVDWCVRAAHAGYRCVVVPSASITHLGSATATGSLRLGYWMRNRLLFMRRNASAAHNVSSLLVFLVVTVPRHIARQGLSVSGWFAVLGCVASAVSWNIADGIRRRSWRRPARLDDQA